ncbi:YkgJ family cysteine cluster protein [Citrobacter meridianamericanus]|uniref:YkgJ family cysteine cluster protein n=1 Tax=Citrobacter meridianamericanus TaxID=2894201 RepID=A0ABT1B715_9ENTR|nr:YkgJ family cysteine cluster protein [Citrobacter meridianamericanus]MCO5781385.1 YkgJ family cysteine cluster protein [Citrobacter meridianamericanus]
MFNEKKVKAIYKKANQDPRYRIQLSEKLLSGLTKEVKQERAACKSGCIHCCYLRVDAYGFEVDSIFTYINSEMNNNTKNLIGEEIKQQFNVIKDLTIEQHHHINVKCPMLINEKCSVYPVRPIACASYHSMSEKYCKQSYDDPYDNSFGIPQSYRVEELKIQTHRFIQEELRAGEPKELITQLFSRYNL